MNTKLVKTIREAIALAGLKDGMTISFHHHLRNGDYVLNLVMDEIAAMGIRDLTVNASALFDTHAPLLDHIKNHVVRKVQTNYISAGIGRQISAGLMDEPVEFRTHGGRPRDIALGITPIDVAFIAAPCSDRMGNCTGKYGRSACGSLGYAFPDAMYAKKVVVITDELAEYPLTGWSIPEIYVDYVVQIDAIGDPAGIVSGTTRMTRNPVALVMAQTAAQVIQNSGLLRDGFSFQTGAGGATLATAMYLKQIMLREQIHGSYAQGGITGYLVDMLNEGCFRALMDVQCFDLKAAASIRDNPNHCEVGAAQYASAAPSWIRSTLPSSARQRSTRILTSMSTPIPPGASWAAPAGTAMPPQAPNSRSSRRPCSAAGFPSSATVSPASQRRARTLMCWSHRRGSPSIPEGKSCASG